MPLRTGAQYIESLRKLKPQVYYMGEKIDSVADSPITRPHVNAMAITFDMALDPQFENLFTTRSHLTGEKINRFAHIHHSADDLVKKVQTIRAAAQRTASCFQRCVGHDAMNALYQVTFEMDQKKGTDYHQKFLKFLRYMQQNDLIPSGSMTDPKGDRSLSPSQQADPDLYVRIVDKKKNGIIVRGAKAHQTGVVNCHELVVLPTVNMRKEDEAYAVAFAIPVDTIGVTMIFGRQTNDTRKLEGEIDAGNPKYGMVGGEALLVFEDVFVPWERVFMCGEYDFAYLLVEKFASFHRQNYGGCKTGVSDVLIGATSLIAQYQGAGAASHIKDKIIEMVHLAETLYCCSIACSAMGYKTPSGAYIVDPLLANVTKLNVTRQIYEIGRLAHDIAGGLLATLPSEKDWRDERVGRYVDKYLKGVKDVPTEHRMRILRLIEAITCGTSLVESMHGAGSPQAQRIMIGRQANIEHKQRLALNLAGISKQ